jgi:hypothetical protein
MQSNARKQVYRFSNNPNSKNATRQTLGSPTTAIRKYYTSELQ